MLRPAITLQQIADLVSGELRAGSAELMISSVACDTRTVKAGGIFVAVPGTAVDGYAFISQALAGGAVAIIAEREVDESVPVILVNDSRQALSVLASHFAGDPSSRMRTFGVTGTNGKTTTAWILSALLEKLSEPTITLGTLGKIERGKITDPESLTTPDAVTLHQWLAEAKVKDLTNCVMEVSSHALAQFRVENVQFNCAIFTNLTRDHLDYHKTFENYFAAKNKLFSLVAQSLKESRSAVVNIDDEAGRKIISSLPSGLTTLYTYGADVTADFRISNYVSHDTGSAFSLGFQNKEYEINTGFLGLHNAFNIAAAVAALVSQGFDLSKILTALPEIPQVPGRLELLKGKDLRVYIDYAHTPDALERALQALRELPHQNLWVVFGCGGDRDKGKRPQMATIAATFADKVVITSDNPRTEDPNQILSDIVASKINYEAALPDRREAINFAINNATPGDVLLVAGKGHEEYQILGTERIHFSDREEVLAGFSKK